MIKGLLSTCAFLSTLAVSVAQIALRESADWKPVDESVRKQLAERGGSKNFVDAAYYIHGGYASVSRAELMEQNGTESIRNFVAGMIHAAEKQGFLVEKNEVREDAPFPRTVYLLRRSGTDTSQKILIYYVCDKTALYVFTIVGDQHLDASSDIVRSYASRAVFTDLVALSASIPDSKIEKAWKEGEANGKAIMIIILLLVLALGFGFWQMRSIKNSDGKNQA